jgi:cellulose synthase (UDP-forming)
VYIVLLPRMSKSQWRFEVMRVQMAYSFAHALAVIHKLTGRSAGWVPTGAAGKKNVLARQISTIGIVTITVTFCWSWAAFGYDVYRLGLHQFWPMGLFLLGYTYLSLPLLKSFIGVVAPERKPRVAPAPKGDITAWTQRHIEGRHLLPELPHLSTLQTTAQGD